MTDALMVAANNAARFAGGHEINRRWAEIIDPEAEDKRTSTEVIEDLRGRMARDFGEERGETA